MRPEVLSPAGSPASLEAAVRAGADAVYFGLRDFNARRNAANFDDGALPGAVSSCHGRGVRVYLTLNTLVRGNEMSRALETARAAAAAGVDGMIVQDLGTARLLRTAAPDLHLHASTQMTIHTPAALPILKEMGFCRVVAAREMSREELAELCAAARELDMEVEVFVHGALCMCVSGQCYLSAMLGGRSGNRGLCAQPCRLPFAVEKGTGFDLSLKDMSLVDHIDALKEMGVASLKIEGRMKRPEYVAAATAVCRMAVDGETPPPDLRGALEAVFSRSGFTDGYFQGTTGPHMFGHRTEADVRRTAAALSGLHGLTRRERQSAPVRGVLTVRRGAPCRLCLSDGTHTVQAEGPVPEEARNRPLDGETAFAYLKKLGGTCFYLDRLDCHLDEGVTLPASVLNGLRRQAAQELADARQTVRPISFAKLRPADLLTGPCPASGRPGRVARFARLEQVPENVTDCGLQAVCLPVETDFSGVSLPGVELWAHLPRGLFGRDAWAAKRLQAAYAAGVRTALCGNLSAAALAGAAGMRVQWDFGMNLMNSHSLEAAAGSGAVGAVLSAECTLEQCREIMEASRPIPCGVFAYGRLPLMLFRNCPGRNRAKGGENVCAACGGQCRITDRKGIDFPIQCRAGCAELFNSRPIWMADRLKELDDFDFLLLYFTVEDRQTCARVLEAYNAGGGPPAAFTRGLLYRGVE